MKTVKEIFITVDELADVKAILDEHGMNEAIQWPEPAVWYVDGGATKKVSIRKDNYEDEVL